ncbi:MAG: GntR family transcriptional regulator [Ktedonobacteraceae bacterium]|nr:GntR family transcriptional regulator [Ktedonobacteraceae bacterium]
MSPDTKIDTITEALRHRIQAGAFGTAGRLPSLRMFAQEFGTTQETMNKVIQRLQAEGLVSSLGQRGIFIRMARARIPGILLRFDLYLKELGMEPVETNLEEPALMPVPKDIAELMKIAPGALIVRRIRRQGTPTAHMRIAENFYPVDLVGGTILEQMQKDERFDVLLAIKEQHNKVIKAVHEDVIGRLPTKEEQDWLKVTRSTPVLEVIRINQAEDGTIVMVNRLIFVASYFVLSYDYTPPHWIDEKQKQKSNA